MSAQKAMLYRQIKEHFDLKQMWAARKIKNTRTVAATVKGSIGATNTVLFIEPRRYDIKYVVRGKS